MTVAGAAGGKDGGWNCDFPGKKLRHSSFMSTIEPLWAYSEIPCSKSTRKMKRSIENEVGFFVDPSRVQVGQSSMAGEATVLYQTTLSNVLLLRRTTRSTGFDQGWDIRMMRGSGVRCNCYCRSVGLMDDATLKATGGQRGISSIQAVREARHLSRLKRLGNLVSG